jgi:hypothetical protein
VTAVSDTSPGPRAQIYGLAFIAAVMHFLGWAGFGIWPLALVCMVPLFAALELGLSQTHGLVTHRSHGHQQGDIEPVLDEQIGDNR